MKRARSVLLLAVGWVLSGCQRDEQPERTTFYDRKIGPVLHGNCSISPTRSSCHVSDGQGNAFGNLSTESFETLDLRRDLMVDYGPYGVPGLLLKVVPPYKISLSRWDGPPTLITTADHDDRVVPSHSFKFAAALQKAQGCPNPVLIRIEVLGSHGYRPTDKLIAERADQWAFAARHTNLH